MRSRSINAFPWASLNPTDPQNAPISIPFEKGIKWYWRVKLWGFTFSVSDGVNLWADAATFAWDYTNNAETGPISGFPANEQKLPIGWQMYNQFVSVTTPSAFQFTFRFFSVAIGGVDPSIQYAAGIVFTNQDGECQPWLRLESNGGNLISGSSTNPDPLLYKASAVTFYIDGEPVQMWEILGATFTGSITLNPSQFWKYDKADLSRPIWDAATGAELLDPHQTDELI